MSISYGGDWKGLESFLKYAWKNDLHTEVDKATKRSALYILSEIRKRIHDREYAVNALSTAQAKGFKSAAEATPLVASGTLIRKALAIASKGDLQWEVGVIKDFPTKDGRSKLSEIVPILHEGGTVTMKRGTTTVTIRIPPRPFLASVFDDPSTERYVNKQWEQAVEKVLKRHGKL